MIFNAPLDLLIERRLAAELPALRPLQLLSLGQLAHEARAAWANPEIRRITPARILRATAAINGVHALALDHLSGGATRAWGHHRATETAALSLQLWQLWQPRAATLAPGDEYDLVDAFAALLGLGEWYAWRADPGDPTPAASAAVSDDDAAAAEEFAVEGVTNPALLRTKHPAAVYFLLAALRRYARLSPEEVKQITLEAALLGREGLDYAGAEKRYALRVLPGETFTGLELMCLLHAGCKQLSPEEDTGMNLDEPFLTALELFNEGNTSETH